MKRNVLKDWVTELPLMQQTVLCSAIRGPDGFAKNDPVKYIIRYLRGTVLNPANPELVAEGRNDVFMNNILGHYYNPTKQSQFQMTCIEFLTNMDPYPLHFILHLAHAAEIIGYKYPDKTRDRHADTPSGPVSSSWIWLYNQICQAFHMSPESVYGLDTRLKY